MILLMNLKQKDFMSMYFNLKTYLSTKIVMKYIIDDKKWYLFIKILFK